MEPHLYLKRGKKNILLVRYFDKFHFITLNQQTHHQARKWLLACPRTVKYVRGVAAGGTGMGMVVQFYLQEGKRRYELKEDCDLSDMSALFDGLESFDPPKKDSNWSDPRLAKQDPFMRNYLWLLGWVLNIVACAVGFMIWAAGFEIPWFCWISLLCIPVSLLLYGFFPDYFTIFSEKRKYRQKKGVLGLWAPLISPVSMIMGAISCYEIFSWWKAWIIGVAAVVALAVILYLSVPAFNAGDKVFAVLLVGLLLSGGPVLALNSLLETAPARLLQTEVMDKEAHTGGKGPDIYELIVLLDGKETEIPVGGKTYSETEIGEIITVEYHEGAFGIGYSQIK